MNAFLGLADAVAGDTLAASRTASRTWVVMAWAGKTFPASQGSPGVEERLLYELTDSAVTIEGAPDVR
jgi:hypothetical protein